MLLLIINIKTLIKLTVLESNSLPKWISNTSLIKQENVQANNPNQQRMTRRYHPETRGNTKILDSVQ